MNPVFLVMSEELRENLQDDQRQAAQFQVADKPAIPPDEQLALICSSTTETITQMRLQLKGGEEGGIADRVSTLSQAQKNLHGISEKTGEAGKLLAEIKEKWATRVQVDAEAHAKDGFYIKRASEFVDYDQIQSFITVARDNLRRFSQGRINQIRYRGEIASLNKQLPSLQKYAAGYQKDVFPQAKRVGEVNQALQNLNHDVEEAAKTTFEQGLTSIEKENQAVKTRAVEAVSDPAWQEQVNEELIRMYLDPEMNKSIEKGEIGSEVADEFRAFARRVMKEGFPQISASWGASAEKIEQVQAASVAFQELTERTKFHAEHWCNVLLLRGDMQPPDRLYSHLAEAMVDLVVKDSYHPLHDLIPLTGESQRDFGRRLKDKEEDSRFTIPEEKEEENPWSLRFKTRSEIVAEALMKIHGLNRWQIVAKKLVDDGIVTSESTNEVEDYYMRTLTDEVLIPGGQEDWSGTGVAYRLAEIGNPKALEYILLYQGLTAAPSGLYAAGHTNNAADYARAQVSSRLSEQDVSQLPSPVFVKNVVQALAFPGSSSLLNPQEVENLEKIQGNSEYGYGRARFSADLFGRQFREIIQEVRENPVIDRRWLTVALRGIGASTIPFKPEDYDLLISMAIETTDVSMQTEILRAFAERVHGISITFSHFEQSDSDLATQALVKFINRAEYKPDTEHLIAVNKVCGVLNLKTWLPAWPAEERAKAQERVEQIGDVLVSWIDTGTLSEKQLFLALQSLDVLEDPKYAPVVFRETKKLFKTEGLEERYRNGAEDRGHYGDHIIFAKDLNRYSVYEMLTDMIVRTQLVTNYVPSAGEPSAREVVLETFRTNSGARAGIKEVFAHGRTEEILDKNPAEKKQYMSDFIHLLNYDFGEQQEEVDKIVLELVRSRLDFIESANDINFISMTEAVAEILARGPAQELELGRKLLPTVAMACERATRNRVDKAPQAQELLAHSCEEWLTAKNEDGSPMERENFLALVALSSIDWQAEAMYEKTDYFTSKLNGGEAEQNLMDKLFLSLPYNSGAQIFEEIKEKYGQGVRDLKIIRQFIYEGTGDAKDIQSAIARVSTRAARGAASTDTDVLRKILPEASDITELFSQKLVGREASVDTLWMLQHFLVNLQAGSVLESVETDDFQSALDDGSKFLETDSSALSLSEDHGRELQLVFIHQVIYLLKTAIRQQRILPSQRDEITAMIKTNSTLYQTALRTL